MKLKISLFNASVIKSDIKRFWWVGLLYFVVLFFILPLQHMLEKLPLEEDLQKQRLLAALHLSHGNAGSLVDGQIILAFTLPVLLAVMLFSYLHSGRASAVLHSFPASREKLLGSHVAAGMLLISAPVAAIAAIMAALAAFTGLGEAYSPINAAEWAALTLLFDLLFFSITVFVGMFTGNAIAHIVFTYILNVLPYGLYMLLVYNLERLLHGFSRVERYNLGWTQAFPLVAIVGFRFESFTLVQGLLYLLAIPVFLAAAGFLYRLRRLEAAGNILSFPVLGPVFKYGVAVCAMLTGGILAGGMNNSGKTAVIVSFFIAAFIGYWASQMLMEKTVKVWRAYRGLLIFFAAVLAVLAGISTDVTGYVHRIPAYSEIESAYFGNSYNAWLWVKGDAAVKGSVEGNIKGVFKEGRNIKALMLLHKLLINDRDTGYGQDTYVAYKLKNGRSVLRRYTVNYAEMKEYVKPLYESPEYRQGKYPVLGQTAGDIKLIEIGDRRTSKKPLILSDSKEVQSFLGVMQTELSAASYEEVMEPEYGYAYIEVLDQKNNRTHYTFSRSFTELNAWLKSNGYYESVMLLPEEIEKVTLTKYAVQALNNGGYAYSSQAYPAESGLKLTDKALIKELVDISQPEPDSYVSGNYILVNFYSRAEALSSDFAGYIYPGAPLSEALKKNLGPILN